MITSSIYLIQQKIYIDTIFLNIKNIKINNIELNITKCNDTLKVDIKLYGKSKAKINKWSYLESN